MAKIWNITKWLDQELEIEKFEDPANNGLQVQGKEEVKRIAFAVDVSKEAIKEAAGRKVDLLITHHSLIWGGVNRIVGLHYERIKLLMKHNIALYVAHLPLDAHAEYGNNILLAKKLGLKDLEKFGTPEIGVQGYGKWTFKDATKLVEKKIAKPLSWYFGPGYCNKVVIVSGSGLSFLQEAKKAGADLFITGEPKHSMYHDAKELGINVLCAGHYATETIGLKKLAAVMKKKYQVSCYFVDAPTGL